jgi:hypothetical protein
LNIQKENKAGVDSQEKYFYFYVSITRGYYLSETKGVVATDDMIFVFLREHGWHDIVLLQASHLFGKPF